MYITTLSWGHFWQLMTLFSAWHRYDRDTSTDYSHSRSYSSHDDHVATIWRHHAVAIALCRGSSFSLDLFGFRFFVLIFFRVPGSRQCGMIPGNAQKKTSTVRSQSPIASVFNTRSDSGQNITEARIFPSLWQIWRSPETAPRPCRGFDTPLTPNQHGQASLACLTDAAVGLTRRAATALWRDVCACTVHRRAAPVKIRTACSPASAPVGVTPRPAQPRARLYQGCRTVWSPEISSKWAMFPYRWLLWWSRIRALSSI